MGVSMISFKRFFARHAECTVQAIIEQIERYEGVSPATGSSLEERWTALMRPESSTGLNVAA